jgi:multidrug resistance efflux pump
MEAMRPATRRRLVSRTLNLLVAGAAVVSTWHLLSTAGIAQIPPTVPHVARPATDGEGELASSSAAAKQAWLKAVEARIKVAQAEQRVAVLLVAKAEAKAECAAAMREYRERELDHMRALAKRRSLSAELVAEEEAHVPEAQATELEARSELAKAHAGARAAGAKVREAEASRNLVRIQIHAPRDGDSGAELKEETQIREAGLDRARAELDVARAEIDRAEANLKKAKATVEYRSKVFDRIKRLGRAKAIGPELVEEVEQTLAEARTAERDAEVSAGLARAHLIDVETRNTRDR